jgi:hypothetical protein
VEGVARNIVVTVVVAAVMAIFVLGYTVAKPPGEPSIKGYLDGKEIKFFHTEVSDAKVAKILTDMIGSPVLAVPALAEVPQGALANVYVFTNGIKGGGPLRFQPDVFDNPPGTPGYSPLRALNLVTWKNGASPRVLKSAPEVKAAESKGEVTITRPGVVVNMPLLTWPGGHR